MPHIHVIYASSSGHTEYVAEVLAKELDGKADVTLQRAEEVESDDFAKGDVLVLGSGTWNTGGVEGQLNPHMYELLKKRAADVDLAGKPCAIIALGDERYFYTARANEHLRRFILDHGSKECTEALLIVNDPYGQEEKVQKWGEKLLAAVS